MIYFCCGDERRALLRNKTWPTDATPLNGIDYVEVDASQCVLSVYFVLQVSSALQGRFASLGPALVRIGGGERIKSISVSQAAWNDSGYLEVHVAAPGDFSTYTLSLVEPPPASAPLAELDPELSSIDFSFKVGCAAVTDCRGSVLCPPPVRYEPDLDYLAKDYNSFRRLILDRMALVNPGWKERNPADLGVALVELLAYVGDYLSYRQDAMATEAYLGTARLRVSVRRHARLVDYRMHEGCNARAWVQVILAEHSSAAGYILPLNLSLKESDTTVVTAGTCFSTDAGRVCVLASDSTGLAQVLDEFEPEVFEPLEEAYLNHAHETMQFYTWGETCCCLPKGAVKAALDTHYPCLAAGHVLVLREALGPDTGLPADADPSKVHAVRLTAVSLGTDPVREAPYTLIEWDAEDALPFPLCLSFAGESEKRASVAHGNIVLVDHGRTLPKAEDLGPVPTPNPALRPVVESDCSFCEEPRSREAPVRYRPRLQRSGLTHAEDLPTDFGNAPAARLACRDPREALPAIRLVDSCREVWRARRDLVESEATVREFVAEVENDGRAGIRFGDGISGMFPGAGTRFYARYRIGNGSSGNVGALAITRIYTPGLLDLGNSDRVVDAGGLVESVTNLLPAWGGIDPESIEEVRQYAPQAFRTQRRCVTPEDYAARAGEHPLVQRAAATMCWTGSWYTIFLTVDRRDGGEVDDGFRADLLAWLEPYRLAGHDLEINGPLFVSLELSLSVQVADGYSRSDVASAIFDVFSARRRPNGSLGFFHPDRFTFGDAVHISAIYAAAQRVAGASYVEVLALRRQDSTADPDLPEGGAYRVGRLEIVRLENNPDFPDHGVLTLDLKGGL